MKSQTRVLYIEDEEDDVFFMHNAFKRLGMEDCFHAVSDGEGAISYLTGREPYLDRERNPLPVVVLLDLSLPMRSGFEFLEWLRGQPQFLSIPVVVFSSSLRTDDRCRAEKLGASEYLLKPTSGAQFLEMVGRLKKRWLSTLTESSLRPPPPPLYMPPKT
jgi:CheY-like chemotaxis protein